MPHVQRTASDNTFHILQFLRSRIATGAARVMLGLCALFVIAGIVSIPSGFSAPINTVAPKQTKPSLPPGHPNISGNDFWAFHSTLVKAAVTTAPSKNSTKISWQGPDFLLTPRMSPHAAHPAPPAASKKSKAKPAAQPVKTLPMRPHAAPAPEAKTPKAPPGPPTFVGSQTCMKCHMSQAETFSKTLMGQIFLKNPRSDHEKLGCEACHGPGSAHVAAGGAEDTGGPGLVTFDADSPRPIEERNKVCLGCHENGQRTLWSGSQHETRGLACTSCHQIMDKASPRNQLLRATEIETCTQCHKDRKAQLWRSSHMPLREGKLQCTSCHNPHGTANQKLLKEATVNETCYTCHAEKRGPFLFEHEPVRDNCMNCHEPHGSIHERLLTVSRPRLCQQCHSEEDHPSEPHSPNALFAFRGGCANCHGGSIHGSNSPSGAQLHR